MEFYFKENKNKEIQTNRQSKDFNEIWNVQTDMNVDQLKWDKIFHNWENPENCKQRKLGKGCIICEMIEKNISVEHLKPKNK